MISRKWLSDLVEPRKEGALFRAYDYLMIVAIIVGTVPLLFRVQIKLFWYFDIISGIIYLVDYILRWITCDLRSDKPKWKAFLLYPFTPMAILDLLSILPTFNLLAPAYKLTKAMRLLKILRFTRIVYYVGPLDIFVTVIKRQLKLLMAVMLVAFFVILITAIIIFQSEHEIDPVTGEYIFKNFYDAFYWAAITLTTVGYGDLHPVSNLGKSLSIISSLFGIATIALPSSIITAGYMQELNRRMKTKKEEYKQVQSTELIRTSKSWDGAEMPDYLRGRPEIVAIKYVIPAGEKLGWHHHPVMNHGILVQGELTIIDQYGNEKVVHEGEAVVEMVNTIHHGENRGTMPVVLYMFYLSQDGLSLSVQHPEISNYD